MKTKAKLVDGVWLGYINPYGDAWYQFGQGTTPQKARANAVIAWHQFNKETGAQT